MAPSNEMDELISMEEGRTNIIVNLQRTTGQTENKQQPSDKIIPCASLRNKFQSLEVAISEDKLKEGKRTPKIQKASYMLQRDEKMKYFEPRMASIGPLHYQEDKSKLAEKLKLKLAALFIKEHQLNKEGLYSKIHGQIESLRRCYIEKDIEKFNNEDLSWMFLVDGCALIHYIDNCDSNKKLRDLKIKMDMEAFAQQDLFLLENQLPYQLLDRVLITSIPDQQQDAVRKSISNFVAKIAGNIRGEVGNVDTSLWKCICTPISKFFDKFVRNIRGRPSTSSSQPPPLPNPPAHLLELLWRHLVGYNKSSQPLKPDNGSPSSCDPDNKSSQNQNVNSRYTYRNVDELKAAWIRFKANTSGSLMDIVFGSFWFLGGTLTLPSLAVDDSTEPMFLNLIAFEMCPDFENDFQISSYISFLDSLIDQPGDVKDLRKARILYNALGSDEKVANIFNEIGTDIVPNPQTYSKVKQDIQSHYKNKWNTWMAQFLHNHFSSPWTILAFLGAVAALAMSGFQTWYTIHPSK